MSNFDTYWSHGSLKIAAATVMVWVRHSQGPPLQDAPLYAIFEHFALHIHLPLPQDVEDIFPVLQYKLD